ncbi:hypothetical protein FC76_GL002326 [Lactiplantibacillus plantarum subsp. plantarum ATCC 14917 = JCM 1149 = CGMCC 1.2437]|nr:hypothetical protein FC76_GL002326 [Lactiplantibacillus plantarum subsp. plantarum ATCC 14917 = JCM 1149 = CGMCC 1.2437]
MAYHISVTDTSQEICDWISHHESLTSFNLGLFLPAGLFHTRDLTFVGQVA